MPAPPEEEAEAQGRCPTTGNYAPPIHLRAATVSCAHRRRKQPSAKMVEIDWNLENTEIICKLFTKQVERGNRSNTHLNSVGYAEVEKGFKEKTSLEISRGQIKNIWEKLKEDYKA